MLIPYGTDAPIYHLPFATGGMIAVNVAAFFGLTWLAGTMSEERFTEVVSQLVLLHGQGLRPWQWVTSNFLHADFLHLLGNMFCLWGFGLVVEGKIGWQRFLMIYLGIGVTQCAAEQTLMLFAEPNGSLGASAIIYGLLAIAMVWAPQNEMNCVFLWLRPVAFEVTLYTLGGIAVLIQIGTGMFAGLAMSSQVLHLMGAGVGFAVGVVMLKKGWVDCEGWDLFSVWAGRETQQKDEDEASARALLADAERKRFAAIRDDSTLSDSPVSATGHSSEGLEPETLFSGSWEVSPSQDGIQTALADNDPGAAFAAYRDFVDDPLNSPPERELLKIISLFHERKQWSASIPAMVEYLRTFTIRQATIRLRLAHVLIDVERRPRQALRVLGKLTPAALSEKDRQTLIKLRAKAEKLGSTVRQESPLEDW